MESLIRDITMKYSKDELNVIIKEIRKDIKEREKFVLEFKNDLISMRVSDEMIEHQCLVKMAILGLITREYATERMIQLEKIILEKDPSQKVNFPNRD